MTNPQCFRNPALHIRIVPGPPVGKPRMTKRDKWKQRPCVMRYRVWCDTARAFVGKVPSASHIASLSITAYVAMPQRWSAARRAQMRGQPHRQKPDLDNILKSVMDALWKDDSGIAEAYVRKVWDDDSYTRIELLLIDDHPQEQSCPQ